MKNMRFASSSALFALATFCSVCLFVSVTLAFRHHQQQFNYPHHARRHNSYFEDDEAQFPLTRIVGGDTVKGSQYPFHVQVKEASGSSCGGTVIGKHSVLTAKHCVQKPSLTIVEGDDDSNVAGDGEKMYQVTDRISHPSADLAIVKVKENLKSPLSIGSRELGPNTMVSTVGRGLLGEYNFKAPNKLQMVKLNIISMAECDSYVKGEVDTDDFYCAGKKGDKKGVCYGDSGSAMFIGSELFGVSYAAVGECGEQTSLFIKLAPYVSWIKQNMS